MRSIVMQMKDLVEHLDRLKLPLGVVFADWISVSCAFSLRSLRLYVQISCLFRPPKTAL